MYINIYITVSITVAAAGFLGFFFSQKKERCIVEVTNVEVTCSNITVVY